MYSLAIEGLSLIGRGVNSIVDYFYVSRVLKFLFFKGLTLFSSLLLAVHLYVIVYVLIIPNMNQRT